ncbi:hypothetical protein [Mesorhizobium sp. IMUNJ 23232]|uniref:hypothetical protein n=1 Tax=Mesorhizobium sp. IMUNJ 23232 TaxID=3376064 RepID=UPI0037904574
MARKAFFAAFIIDEDSYTPEPGPVDEHFVAADLAQSNFGEQPGVSHIVVWSSAANLIADHRQRGPITVDYLSGQQPAPDEVTPPFFASSFRDLLVPVMRDTLAFEYYEVRPCIERDRQVSSYADEGDYGADLKAAEESGAEFRTFWSLYGIDASAHTAIGDFVSKDAAYEIMNAILAVPAAARNALQGARSQENTDREGIEQAARSAADWLDDMINQSSNDRRI